MAVSVCCTLRVVRTLRLRVVLRAGKEIEDEGTSRGEGEDVKEPGVCGKEKGEKGDAVWEGKVEALFGEQAPPPRSQKRSPLLLRHHFSVRTWHVLTFLL